MKVCIVTPAPPGSRKGNRVTAQRWSRILRSLGHRVAVKQRFVDGTYDLLIALHARRSADAVDRFARRHPDRPIIVAVTGTDLYRDLRRSAAARRSLRAADRLIVLQPKAVESLPTDLQHKARIIHQSAPRPTWNVVRRADVFDVCVLGHLRPVKDPFRAARASRRLPPSSRIVVTHVGRALSAAMADRARDEAVANPRYRWRGDLPRWRALRVLARSRLLVLSSRMEGGANVLSESIAASVPTIASRIAGSIGILGQDYPAYFTVGDTSALADLLLRCEADVAFYRRLQAWCRRLAPLVDPARETRAWKQVMNELNRSSTRRPRAGP